MSSNIPETMQVPPSDRSAERALLATLLLSPEKIREAAALLSPADFYDSGNKLIFAVFKSMDTRGIPIDVITLIDELRKTGEVKSEEELRSYLDVLLNDTASCSLEYTARILREQANRRAALNTSYELQKLVSADAPMEEITGTLDTLKKSIANTPDEIAVHKFSWGDNPQEENSLLTFCGEEILSPEGIALLTGPSGKGKTQACLAIAAACLNPECDSFQFKPNVNSILYVDTENPLKIFRKNIRRCIISRAGLMEGSQLSVEFVNIRMIEKWEQRQKWLFDRLNSEDVPKLILIDGAGDFILDVNDIPSSVDFVSRLCATTTKTRCGIFLTLHGNPMQNTEKARGHIGSELLRKVDCSLLLKVEGEIRTITTEFACGKNRSAADNLTAHFQWDPMRMLHVSCDGPAPAKGKSATDREKVMELGRTQTKWVRADIIKSIQGLLKNSKDESISFETAKRRFNEIVDSHDAFKNDDGTYSFTAKEQLEASEYYNN